MSNAKITGIVTKEITVRGDVKHTYISSGGGGGEFKPFDVVNSIAKSFYRAEPERIVSYLYAPKRESDGDKFVVFKKNSSDVVNLGVRPVGFSENFSTVSCGIVFGANNSFETIYSGNDWVVSGQNSYSSWYSSEPLERNLYNLINFGSHHPVFNDTDFVKIGEEVTINFANDFRIGDIFNTEITANDTIIIFKFSAGTSHLYKFAKTDKIILNSTGSTYNFNYNSKKCTLHDKLNTNIYQKSNLGYYDDSGGVSGIVINEDILAVTSDVYDNNGNLLFSKNANIEDFI